MKKRKISLFSVMLAFIIFLFGVVLFTADPMNDPLGFKAQAVSVGDSVEDGVVVASDDSFCRCCHEHNHGNNIYDRISCVICRIKHASRRLFGFVEINPEHKYKIASTTAATCTAEGSSQLCCAVCDSTKTIIIEKLPHTWDAGMVTTEPTCTAAGIKKLTCTECGAEKNEEIGALGHSYISEVNDPTCTEDGYAIHTCSRCGYVQTETFPALGHNYADVVTEPTCTQQGYIIHTCSRCGSSYTDYMDARHDFIDGTAVNDLTVSANSGKVTATYTCAVCGESVTGGEIPASASVGGYEKVYHTLQAAVSAADGETVYLLCDYTLREDLTIPSGVTVVIPCLAGDTGYTTHNDDGAYNMYCPDNAGTVVAPAQFRSLTVAGGVTVNVYGTLLINAVTGGAAGGFDDYGITGNYACINLGGNINVLPGGVLDCSGYVNDNGGEILVQNSAKVFETFGVMRWRGGSYAYAAAMKSSTKCCFPIENYDFNYIRAKLTIEYGALYSGTVKMFASNSYYYCHFPQIGSSSNAIYLLESGARCVRNVTETGKAVYKFYGDVTFSTTKLKVASYQMSTDKCGYYKLDGNTQTEFYDGTVTCNNKYHFLPGFQLVIGSGATLNIGSGGGMLFSTATDYTLNGTQYYSYYYFDQQYDTTTKWYIPGRDDAAMYILDGGSVNVAGTTDAKAEIAGRIYVDDVSSFSTVSGVASESISRYVAYGSVSGSTIFAKVNMNQYDTVLLRNTLDAAAKAAVKTALGLE